MCLRLNIKAEKRSDLLSIFNGTPNDSREYYELKEDYTDYKALKAKFISVLGKLTNESIIKNAFTMTGDLNGIPESLIEEIKLNNVAVFVGAGISKLVSGDYPLWDELANNSIEHLYGKGRLNFYEKEKLKSDISDPKQKLSIFEKHIEKDSPEYEGFLKINFGEHIVADNSHANPYKLLCSKSFNFIKVTSNIDLEFAKAYEQSLEEEGSLVAGINQEKLERSRQIRNPYDFIEGAKFTGNFRNDKIYMIHGNIRDYKKTIFTTEDYIQEYFSGRGNISKFLEQLFKDKTVIFIGYGLSEFPVLERIISAGNRKHYILLPTFLSEINFSIKQSAHLQKLNIETLPYYIDSEGYHRIISVLENWDKIIGTKTLENIDFIDEFLKEENGN